MKKTMMLFLTGIMLFAAPVADAAGAKLIGKAIDETLEIAAKRSGTALSRGMRSKLGNTLVKLSARYGDDVLKIVREGGLEAIEQGARHGDDFWRFCRTVPEASRSLALHADDLLPLARRIGPEVLKVEARAPGMALRVAGEFGDDAIRLLAKKPPQDISRLVGYAAKADSPATKQLLLEKYTASKNPAKFLESFTWKHVMAGGLSAAAITAAHKISDGVETGLKNPETAQDFFHEIIAPFQYGLLALFGIVLFPLGAICIRKGIRYWKTKNK
ncbi:MAG: hypothetical protein MJ016_01125 [Victivallaceae bacterium]|nr:hypothetical protein [Victivallaceae bacterium]